MAKRRRFFTAPKELHWFDYLQEQERPEFDCRWNGKPMIGTIHSLDDIYLDQERRLIQTIAFMGDIFLKPPRRYHSGRPKRKREQATTENVITAIRESLTMYPMTPNKLRERLLPEFRPMMNHAIYEMAKAGNIRRIGPKLSVDIK